MAGKKGIRKKKDEEVFISSTLRMDRWLDSRLHILYEIDKRKIGNKKLQYSVWIRGLLFNLTEERKSEIDYFNKLFSELSGSVTTVGTVNSGE